MYNVPSEQGISSGQLADRTGYVRSYISTTESLDGLTVFDDVIEVPPNVGKDAKRVDRIGTDCFGRSEDNCGRRIFPLG